jgi:hypothetical protein
MWQQPALNRRLSRQARADSQLARVAAAVASGLVVGQSRAGVLCNATLSSDEPPLSSLRTRRGFAALLGLAPALRAAYLKDTSAIMPKYFCDYCDTYLSISVRRLAAAGGTATRRCRSCARVRVHSIHSADRVRPTFHLHPAAKRPQTA